MTSPDPATPGTSPPAHGPEEVPYIRGGVGVINRRAVVRGVVGVLALSLVALGIVLGVEAINHNGRINRLKHHGVAVTATVTSCYGIAGGTGITQDGFVCHGQFTLDGTSYTQRIGGTAVDYAVGQQVAAVVEPGHPGTLTTAAAVSASHSSIDNVVFPVILLVLGGLSAAFLVAFSRRMGSASPADSRSGPAAPSPAAPTPSGVAGATDTARTSDPARVGTRASYDAVAADYLANIGSELDAKPLDRALLGALLELTDASLPVGDLGCGPGHIAAWCAGQGRSVVGIDLSPQMVALGRQTFPAVEFRVGDLIALPAADGEFGAAIAAYSWIHLAPGELPAAAAELARVLRPGGSALIAFHLGTDVVHREEWWGHPVDVDFRFMRSDVVVGHLEKAGFAVTARLERAPNTTEVDTQRAYLIARRS